MIALKKNSTVIIAFKTASCPIWRQLRLQHAQGLHMVWGKAGFSDIKLSCWSNNRT